MKDVTKILIEYLPCNPWFNKFPWYVQIESSVGSQMKRFSLLSEVFVWVNEIVEQE